MKTDLERLLELYKSFGIELEAEEEDEGFTIYLEEGKGFCGYRGFISIISFSPKGSFLNQGFWE